MPSIQAGAWARYQVAEGKLAGPGIDAIVLATPGIERTADGERIWFQLEAFAKEKRLFAIAMLTSSLDFLRTNGPAVTIDRYVLFPANGDPLEYVSKQTDKALLPNFDFLKTLVPKASGLESDPFFMEGTFLGHPIRRVLTGKEAQRLPVSQARRLILDTDLVIGTSRNYKDEEGVYAPAQEDDDPDRKNYTYTPLTPDDYVTLIQKVGMNRFPIAKDQLIHVIDQPVFFIMTRGFEDLPEILYRSNFLGTQQFMDEPVTIAIHHLTLADAKTPQEAAERMIKQIRKEKARDVRLLAKALKTAGWDLGEADILQGEFPVWEACPSAAWYELEAGLTGYIYEGRPNPKLFSEYMKEMLDVDFPENLEAGIKMNYAFLRGAARRFGRPWGTSIYGHAVPEAVGRMFPLAYDAGASYFWFWTSDHNHHMPFPEQKQLTRKFREYVTDHTRPAPPEKLTARAQTAIALPWGYLVGIIELTHAKGTLWNSPQMQLDMDNGHGTTYKAVLRVAMKQATRLLLEDIRFDFIFLREGEQSQGYGYEEIYRVLENGEIVVEY